MLKALGKNFENLPISNVPVYYGGSDGEATVVLTAWVFDEEKRVFEIYYTLNGDEATELMKKANNIQFRAFLGFCKFDEKIYDDIEKGLWIIGDAKNLFGAQEHTETLWQTMLLKESPNALIPQIEPFGEEQTCSGYWAATAAHAANARSRRQTLRSLEVRCHAPDLCRFRAINGSTREAIPFQSI
jgi:hypothetical protein